MPGPVFCPPGTDREIIGGVIGASYWIGFTWTDVASEDHRVGDTVIIAGECRVEARKRGARYAYWTV
jgi:hypothetical protein